ncbi:hypothetical protein L1887_50885 [Cichorium endivia]|nr:hypothetical protein L1887_50885 [Cichorium endivia]
MRQPRPKRRDLGSGIGASPNRLFFRAAHAPSRSYDVTAPRRFGPSLNSNSRLLRLFSTSDALTPGRQCLMKRKIGCETREDRIQTEVDRAGSIPVCAAAVCPLCMEGSEGPANSAKNRTRRCTSPETAPSHDQGGRLRYASQFFLTYPQTALWRLRGPARPAGSMARPHLLASQQRSAESWAEACRLASAIQPFGAQPERAVLDGCLMSAFRRASIHGIGVPSLSSITHQLALLCLPVGSIRTLALPLQT